MSTNKNNTDTRKVVEGMQKMTPSEAFVETLVANGVTDMFGIMAQLYGCYGYFRTSWYPFDSGCT